MGRHDFRVDRLARLALRLLIAGLFRVRVRGVENLSAVALPVRLPPGGGGWIVAPVPHRNWVEPALLLAILPLERRAKTVADARTALPSWWRRLAAAIVGGAIPVGRGAGPGGFRRHVEAARRVIQRGGVLTIYPEVGPPSHAPALRRLSPGVARLAGSAGAAVVPVVLGGTDELYLGRRIEVRILPPIAPPPVDAGRIAVNAWMADFRALLESEAAAAHASANARQPGRKRWKWLGGPYPKA